MPVIASKVGAIPEMVIQNKTGLLTNPGSVEELADAIKTLLFDNYLREKMSLSAKEYSKKFAFENSIKSLEELYHGISSS
jgi:glycosyltransferase involved in cell wall biosynthesis